MFTNKNSRVLLLFSLFITAALLFVTRDGHGDTEDFKEKRAIFMTKAVSSTIMAPLAQTLEGNLDGSFEDEKRGHSTQATPQKNQEPNPQVRNVSQVSHIVPSNRADEVSEYIAHFEKIRPVEQIWNQQINNSTYKVELVLKVLQGELRRIELKLNRLIPSSGLGLELHSVIIEQDINRIKLDRIGDNPIKLGFPAKVYIAKAGRLSRAIGRTHIRLKHKDNGEPILASVEIQLGERTDNVTLQNQLNFLIGESGEPSLSFQQEFSLTQSKAS